MPDIESQLAPYSFTHGRSLVLAYDPVSQTGLFAALKLDDHWMVQVGLSAGNDIMAWDVRSQRLTPSACLQWLSPSGDDSLYPCVNGVSDPRYGYNSVQQNTLSWYHKTGTPLHFATEVWYMRDRR
jgi:hypothetical protein